ncbi:hypothetical protein [uncultured Tateyamaria sp.]
MTALPGSIWTPSKHPILKPICPRSPEAHRKPPIS